MLIPVLFKLAQIHQVGLVDENVHLFRVGHLLKTLKNLLDIFQACLRRMLCRHSQEYYPCTLIVHFGHRTISLLACSIPQLQVVISRIMFEMRGIKIDSNGCLRDSLLKEAVSEFGENTRFAH